MGQESFIYRHILIYRFIMNILYRGKYKARFTQVINQINTLPVNSQVLELCFGDTYIADFCKKAGYKWKGIDLNKHFVKQAQKLGYEAYFEDLATLETLPKATVCIMIGSLYHFHPDTFSIVSKMCKASDLVVISEPVSNLSNSDGLVGFLARRAASVGKGNEEFRYNASSFLAIIKECSAALDFNIVSTQHYGKDIIIKLKKNGSN